MDKQACEDYFKSENELIVFPLLARRLIEESGKQFDPQAVAAFLAVPAEEWEPIRVRVMDEIKQRRDLKQ